MIIYYCDKCGARWAAGILESAHRKVCTGAHAPPAVRLDGGGQQKYSRRKQMRRPSNLPPGVTDCIIEDFQESNESKHTPPGPPTLLEALEELVTLVEDARQGEYEIDYYTTQPARAAIASERDRLREVNAMLFSALNLAAKYLAKAVTDDLMTDCVRPPRYALDQANAAIAAAKRGNLK